MKLWNMEKDKEEHQYRLGTNEWLNMRSNGAAKLPLFAS